MNKWSRMAVTSALALAMTSPAFAQSAGTNPDPRPAPKPAAESTVGAAPTATGSDIIARQQGDQVLSSELVGMKVIGADGESIGSVANLIVADGTIVGAVLDVGGFLGLGAKEVGVPWNALDVSDREGKLVATLPMSKDELADMPEFKTLADLKADEARKAATTRTDSGITGSGTVKQ